MMAANRTQGLSEDGGEAEAAAGGGMTWLTSLGLSVS